MRNRHKYTIHKILFLILLFMSTSTLFAQSKLGVYWQPKSGENINDAIADLKSTPTQLVIIPSDVDNSIIKNLARANLPFLVDLNLEYYTQTEISRHQDDIISVLESINSRYQAVEAFSGFIVFKNSALNGTKIDTSITNITQNASIRNDLKLYEISNSGLKTLGDRSKTGIVRYYQKGGSNSINDFANSIGADDIYLIVDYGWLNISLQNESDFKAALQASNQLNEAVIPLKIHQDDEQYLNWPLVLILALWVILGINIASNDDYKKTISRYFLSHAFYVDDIIQYRDRAVNGSIFIIIAHSIFGGLTVYFLARSFISEIGMAALHHHYPLISYFGQHYVALFVLGCLIILLLQIIAIFWLAIFNPQIRNIGQIVSLYSWIFHIDYILITIVAVLFISDGSQKLILFCSALFLLIWYNSFTLTAINSSKRLGSLRFGYLLKTIGLHTIVTLKGIAILMIFDDWLEVIKLSFSI